MQEVMNYICAYVVDGKTERKVDECIRWKREGKKENKL